jgi:acyl-CoA synthetase (AMP-forming)/AMP-acid ligase II
VAYVTVGARPGDHALDTIKAQCAQRLPGYMIPATISITASLPRLTNGKIDRAALASHARKGS